MSTTPEISFDDWLATGTTAQVEVETYSDQAALSRYTAAAALVRDYQTMAKAKKEGAESSITDGDDELQALIADAESAWEDVEASRAVWTVRALSVDEVDEIHATHPAEKMPDQPGKNSPAGARTIYEQKMKSWAADAAALQLAANAEMVAKAFISMTTAAGTVTSITGGQLLRFRSEPGHLSDFGRLVNAVAEATRDDKVPAAPFWRPNSEGAQA